LVVLGEDGPLAEKLTECNVEVVVLERMAIIDRRIFKSPKLFSTFVLNYFRGQRDFKKVIKRFKPQIIHTNISLILTSGLVAKREKIPHIWHIRESFQEFGLLWNFYRQVMISLSDRIISVSTPIADQFPKKMKESKISVLHNGFPKEEFEGITEERVNSFKRRWNITESINVGVVGRLKLKRKGQEVLIRAASILQEYTNVRFLIIGDPFPGNEDHMHIMKDMVRELNLEDRVIFTGGVEDIKAAYKALDISVLTSALPEPFGGVVIESMALGIPVVGTNIGGTVEQIAENETGLKVRPANPIELASALAKLIQSKEMRKMFGENGKKRFLELFEFENFYRGMIKIYEEVKK
jgi:glycosyltransferase involved in cell wall biosynthesis